METPIGDLLLAGTEQGLAVIDFQQGEKRCAPAPDWRLDDAVFPDVEQQLREYFEGKRRNFDLPLQPTGTEFQLAVLAELQKIPYGETVSYGDIAERLGRPKAVRAVGAANGRNPLPIVIPCHRVIGSNGSLTGFGGGLPAKRALLQLESENSGLFAPPAA